MRAYTLYAERLCYTERCAFRRRLFKHGGVSSVHAFCLALAPHSCSVWGIGPPEHAISLALYALVQPEYPAAALGFRNARNSIISDPQDSGLRVVLNAPVPWRRMNVSNHPVET